MVYKIKGPRMGVPRGYVVSTQRGERRLWRRLMDLSLEEDRCFWGKELIPRPMPRFVWTTPEGERMAATVGPMGEMIPFRRYKVS